MPKTKLENFVFTVIMAFIMVYAMICYNISLNIGGMQQIAERNATAVVFFLSMHSLSAHDGSSLITRQNRTQHSPPALLPE